MLYSIEIFPLYHKKTKISIYEFLSISTTVFFWERKKLEKEILCLKMIKVLTNQSLGNKVQFSRAHCAISCCTNLQGSSLQRSPIKAEFVMKKQWINKWEGTGLANTCDYK